MAGQAHHRDPRFTKASRLVKAAAYRDPHAICWRCGLTLAQHPPHVDGKPQRWHGGHTIDGELGPPWLDVRRRPPVGFAFIAPEASRCNVVAGNEARHLNGDTGFND